MVPARPVRSIAPIECHPSTHGRHKRAKRRGGLPFPPLRVKLQKQIIIGQIFDEPPAGWVRPSSGARARSPPAPAGESLGASEWRCGMPQKTSSTASRTRGSRQATRLPSTRPQRRNGMRERNSRQRPAPLLHPGRLLSARLQMLSAKLQRWRHGGREGWSGGAFSTQEARTVGQ